VILVRLRDAPRNRPSAIETSTVACFGFYDLDRRGNQDEHAQEDIGHVVLSAV